MKSKSQFIDIIIPMSDILSMVFHVITYRELVKRVYVCGL